MKFKNLIYKIGPALSLVFVCGFVYTQPQSPNLLCADVQMDGTVVLTWEQVPNINDGNFYRIYRDIGAGFVEIVNNLPHTTTTFTDYFVDASTESVKYRAQVHGSQTSAPGNTVSTLLLSLLPSGSSIAHLSWNMPFSTFPSDGNFAVYRSIDGNPFVSIASLPIETTTYIDTLFGLCDLVEPNKQFMVFYKVSFKRIACEMFSPPSAGEFRDNLGPGLVEVETVSIDPITGLPEIYWYPITNAPDLKDYTIRTIENGTETTVGIVPAFQNTNFIYTDGSLDGVTTFQIIAHDSCNVESGYEKEYTTIRAKADYPDCDKFAKLGWLKYKGWEEGVALYNLYINKNNEGYELADSFSADESEHDLPIEPNTEYCFYIEAVSNGTQRPSTTNSYCFTTNYPVVAQFNYLNRVTTINDGEIQIDLLQDTNSQGTIYELFRADAGDFYQSLGTYQKDNNSILTVVDKNVNADVKVYKYKWVAYDGCGAEIGESNVGKNVVLSAFADSDTLVNSLTWTSYGNWDGNVEQYEIYRQINPTTGFEWFEAVNFKTFSFIDDVSSFISDAGEFCYKIVAVEGENQYDSQTISESNVVCLAQNPIMWIPNAIVLGGYNHTFAPVAGFIDFESYKMEIYNKWGQILFESQDINDGWDGTFKGKKVPEDYYRYIIVYRDGSGKSYIKQGVLYVLTAS